MSESQAEQISGLRRMTKPRPVQVIAVTSGKGGVGKTNVSVNLSLALAQAGKDVMLLDADLGLANVDVLLGLHANYNLHHVITGERNLEEIMLTGPFGVQIVPAASGIQDMAQLTSAQHAGLIRAFSELSCRLDTLVIDTAAGISDSVIRFSLASQETIIVVCDEPTSLTDAYALIKLLHKDYGLYRFHILANMVNNANEGRELFNKLAKVTDRFLDVTLNFVGAVPYDEYLRRSLQRQRAVVDAYPRSKSAVAFRTLAQKVVRWPLPATAGGQLEFFVERLIQASQSEGGLLI